MASLLRQPQLLLKIGPLLYRNLGIVQPVSQVIGLTARPRHRRRTSDNRKNNARQYHVYACAFHCRAVPFAHNRWCKILSLFLPCNRVIPIDTVQNQNPGVFLPLALLGVGLKCAGCSEGWMRRRGSALRAEVLLLCAILPARPILLQFPPQYRAVLLPGGRGRGP